MAQMDDCNLVKVSRDFMRAPDRGRVVAHAYRDDAVIAICRQKRTHGGAMALVLAPSTGAPPRGIRAAPNPPETVLRRLHGRSGGGAAPPHGGVLASAYLGLVAQSVGAIDPDVLCETFAFLVEFHVFRELLTVLSVCDERSVGNFFPAGY
jgi:hypothetical protein